MGRPKAGAAEFLPEFTHLKKTVNSHFTRMNIAQKTGYAHFRLHPPVDGPQPIDFNAVRSA